MCLRLDRVGVPRDTGCLRMLILLSGCRNSPIAYADSPGHLANLDERGFYRLLGSSPEVWAVFSAAATTHLHRNLVSNGSARRKLPDGLMLRTLLRVGLPCGSSTRSRARRRR